MGLVDPVERRAYHREWERKWKEKHGISYRTHWNILHPEQAKAQHEKANYQNKYDPIVRARYRTKFTLKRIELKTSVFVAYGGVRCVCCGETELEFLSLDHSRDDGADHRKRLGRNTLGQTFYYWLRRHGFPQDLGLQVLCFNCNCGRQINGGVCPHQVKQ